MSNMPNPPGPQYPPQAQQPQNWQQPLPLVKEKKRGWLKWAVPVATFLVGLGMGSSGSNSTTNTSSTTQPTATVTRTVSSGASSAKPAATATVTATTTVTASAEANSQDNNTSSSSNQLGSGTFEVGTGKDMTPGKYKVVPEDGSSCYWATLKDADGTMDSIIANDNITGPTVVVVKSQVNYFQSSGCSITKI